MLKVNDYILDKKSENIKKYDKNKVNHIIKISKGNSISYNIRNG